jgi:hypothetical protein
MKKVEWVTLAGVWGSAGLVAFNLAWIAIERHRAYKHASPGWIVDFSIPGWVTTVGNIGLLIFLVTAITRLTFAITNAIRSRRQLG